MPNDIKERRARAIREATARMRDAFSAPDAQIIRAVHTLDELDRAFNALFEQAQTWYTHYFPELRNYVEDPDAYLKLVTELREREAFEEENIVQLLGDPEAAREIARASRDSAGGALGEEDRAQVTQLAVNALKLREQRKSLERYLEKTMGAALPCFCALCGPVLGARMLSRAGSIRDLARMPASRLQTLGAERALFRHLRTNRQADPPKHGFLFAHPLVAPLAPHAKGNMARTLAAKLALCARADAQGAALDTDALRTALERRAEQLRTKRKKPPARKPGRPTRHLTRPFLRKKKFGRKKRG